MGKQKALTHKKPTSRELKKRYKKKYGKGVFGYSKTTLIGDEKIVYAASLHYWSYVFPAMMALIGGFILFVPPMDASELQETHEGVMTVVDHIQFWLAERMDDVKELVPDSVEPFFNAAAGLRQYMVGFMLFGFGVGGLASAYMKKKTLEFVVTTDKIVFKKGFIQRDATELNLERIESVKVKQNAFDRTIGKGRVFVMGVGMEQVNLKNIADPVKFHHIVLEQMNIKRKESY